MYTIQKNKNKFNSFIIIKIINKQGWIKRFGDLGKKKRSYYSNNQFNLYAMGVKVEKERTNNSKNSRI